MSIMVGCDGRSNRGCDELDKIHMNHLSIKYSSTYDIEIQPFERHHQCTCTYVQMRMLASVHSMCKSVPVNRGILLICHDLEG